MFSHVGMRSGAIDTSAFKSLELDERWQDVVVLKSKSWVSKGFIEFKGYCIPICRSLQYAE